jgi:hypothetical protein
MAVARGISAEFGANGAKLLHFWEKMKSAAYADRITGDEWALKT